MIIVDCEQYSDEWWNARLGIPTASSFSKIITGGGNPSSSATGYMHKLVAEYIAGEAEDTHKSDAMQRGSEMEQEAREWYEFTQDAVVTEVGLIYRSEDKLVSCSPDGLVAYDPSMNSANRGLEIKCPLAHTQVKYLLAGKLPAEYVAQVQGSMWVTGLEQWDFLSYHPKLPKLLITVERDEEFHKALNTQMPAFIKKMLAARKKLEELK